MKYSVPNLMLALRSEKISFYMGAMDIFSKGISEDSTQTCANVEVDVYEKANEQHCVDLIIAVVTSAIFFIPK